MERKEELTQVLNDLLKINGDRIEVYRKAAKEISDFDWQTIFYSVIDESTKFGMELALAVLKYGGAPRQRSLTTCGKIYKVWMEIKDSIKGKDRESILNDCEFAEEAITTAYLKAQEHEQLTDELKQLLVRQLEIIRESQETFTRFRDEALMKLYRI